jgi:hypothetical protein
MRSSVFGDVRFLVSAALLSSFLSIFAGCFHDPDINKITCNQPKGCPTGYTCAVSGKCCKSADGITCDAVDAATSEVQSRIDSSVADGISPVDGPAVDATRDIVADTAGAAGNDSAGGSIDAGGTGGAGGNTTEGTDGPVAHGGAGGTGGAGGSQDASLPDAGLPDASLVDASGTDASDVAIVALPVISSFTASATTVTAGKSATLSWSVTGAASVTIDQAIGTVPATSTKVVTPAQTTTYTLTAQNSAGGSLVTAKVVVTVVPAPTIASFTPASGTVTPGTGTTLTVSFASGTGAVDKGIGSVSSGTAVSTGALSVTTTYTLTVTNPAGDTATAQVTVKVVGFVATGSMHAARVYHTATLLANGKVLIAGGYDGSTSLAGADLYDPATGLFSATGNLVVARNSHTATLLANGKVLIAGGTGSDYLVSAELYDPATGSFTATNSMSTPRASHTATLLPTGKVLIAGGTGSDLLASAELYDPVAGSFTVTGSMAAARDDHSAILLANGLVLIAAGGLTDAELYDPSSGLFSATGSMNAPRAYATATLTGSGTVVFTGGLGAALSPVATAEIYDPLNKNFSTVVSVMTSARDLHTATLLLDGKILVAGGEGLSSADLYDPGSQIFTATASMTTTRQSHTATLLVSGAVLIAGGFMGFNGDLPVYLSSAELYYH